METEEVSVTATFERTMFACYAEGVGVVQPGLRRS